jgi:uncharacterized protein
MYIDMSGSRLPLMRKAIAVWLVDNTALTFEQIADFCGMHELEIRGIADGDVAGGIVAQNPIDNGQLTREMIIACEEDPDKKLELKEQISDIIDITVKKKGKYTPIARRSDKPSAIAYLIRCYPDISDVQIRKLIGTTTNMIDSIKNRTHWNIKEIIPRDPVLLGLCSQSLFNQVIDEVKKATKK